MKRPKTIARIIPPGAVTLKATGLNALRFSDKVTLLTPDLLERMARLRRDK